MQALTAALAASHAAARHAERSARAAREDARAARRERGELARELAQTSQRLAEQAQLAREAERVLAAAARRRAREGDAHRLTGRLVACEAALQAAREQLRQHARELRQARLFCAELLARLDTGATARRAGVSSGADMVWPPIPPRAASPPLRPPAVCTLGAHSSGGGIPRELRAAVDSASQCACPAWTKHQLALHVRD